MDFSDSFVALLTLELHPAVRTSIPIRAARRENDAILLRVMTLLLGYLFTIFNRHIINHVPDYLK
jgi:hypothetical protein